MEFDIVASLIGLIVTVIVLVIFVVPPLWLSGRLLAGKNNAKFTDAFWIVMLGAAVMYLFNAFVASLVSGIIMTLVAYFVMLVIWLGLVKHFFDCGWVKAFLISIIALVVAIVIMLVIGFVLALVGIATQWLPIPTQFTTI
ncbi:MAG: hypothetical protein NWE92_11370 [Candidatus Bathyarchaeota archaeon]|nr:hypothetical protein [Candidatus Bathyarchaeota archaeon]